MGSITALELLRQAEPNRVKAAILMSVNPRNETLERKAGREKVMEEVEKTSVQQIIRKKFAPIYFHGDRPNLRSLSIKMAVDLGPEVMNRQATALMKRPNNVPFLNALQIPVLIIGGEHDSLVPVATLKNTARKIPNAELIILNDAAHFPGLERPEITNNIIGTWITQVENRG
jgi:pimeloyl-ACP methyl ester carboxylesterase